MEPAVKLVTYTALAFTAEAHNQQIQALRKIHDPAYQRWQPHINFCFPFVDRPFFDKAYETLQDRLKNIQPFQITFRKMAFFAHNGTVFLRPETKNNQLEQIHNIIIDAIPELKQKRQFIPHMTVGKFKKGEVEKRKDELEKDWKQWTVLCNSLNIIERDRDTPFQTFKKIQFKG